MYGEREKRPFRKESPEAAKRKAELLCKRYLAGLRRYKEHGVKVLIDGREVPEKNWPRIFRIAEDGGFYMADFVAEPEGGVREIRFDRINIHRLYD